MPASDESRWWLAAQVVVGVATVVLPWSLGGSPPWSTAVLFGLGVTSFALWCVGASRNHRRFGWHPALWLPLLVLGVALAQLVPLPDGLVRLLSPPLAELRDFALVPLGLTHARPISTDPSSTARAVARVVGLLGLFATTVQLSVLPHVRRRFAAALVLSGVSVAVCGFGHLLAAEDELFGMYRFVQVMLVTPFGNTNHLAAFLSLTGTVALALAIDSKTRDQVIGWLGAAFICGVGVFLSYSRGGIASFLATWVLVGAALLARRGGGWRPMLPWVAIGSTLVFAAMLSFEQLADRAESLSSLDRLKTTKIELWPMLAQGALHYWPSGLGLGAFELGFARFQTTQLDVTFTHPENLVLQWVAEVGVPLSVLLWGLLATIAWRVWRSVRGGNLERYLFLALVGVGLHDLFDFALELNALAACAAVVAGIVVAAGGEAKRVRLEARGLWLAGFIAAVGLVGLVAGRNHHLSEEQALAEAIRSAQVPSTIRARALDSIDRHPADWVLYANVASDLAARGDARESLAWINRVLFLRPADARIHTAAARALLRLGRPLQALGELKLAWELNDLSTLALGLDLAARAGLWDRLLVDRPGFLTQAWSALRVGNRNDEAAALLAVAVEFGPSVEVRGEAGRLRVRHEAELGDPANALRMLDALDLPARTHPEVELVRIRLLLRMKQVDVAVAELEKLFVKNPADTAIGLELVGVLGTLNRPIAALEVLERMRPFVSGTMERSTMLQREAALWAADERWGRAIEALQTACRIEPLRPGLHYRLAELFERMGSLHSALDEVRRGRALDTPQGAQEKDAWVERLLAAQAPQ